MKIYYRMIAPGGTTSQLDLDWKLSSTKRRELDPTNHNLQIMMFLSPLLLLLELLARYVLLDSVHSYWDVPVRQGAVDLASETN